ncbi:MAG: methionyl-tRNA formyltransferase [bacterium]|nr:methionyl-tRNA formyltransferase [bacterium]
MRYIFFGSPKFAAIFLERVILAGLPPVAVVCNPDRPVGRKKVITPPPVKQLITEYNLQSRRLLDRDSDLASQASERTIKEKILIFQPASRSELTAYSLQLKALNVDLFVVAAYANIIPDSVLKISRRGVIGIHPSLLPKYRGATPIQSVLLAGEQRTGTSLYQMDAKVDNGPVIAQKDLAVDLNETYLSLETKLAQLGADLFINRAQDYIEDKLKPSEQNHAEVTFTKKFETKDAEVDFAKDDPLSIYRKIQALNPEPGAYTFSFPGYENKRVKLLSASYEDGLIHITKIQPDGKKPVTLTEKSK